MVRTSRTKLISCRIPNALADDLAQRAKVDGRSTTDLVVAALSIILKNNAGLGQTEAGVVISERIFEN